LEALVVNNPHIDDPNLLFPGDILCVPSQAPPSEGGRVPESCPQGFDSYTVVTGDTMAKIAQRLSLDIGLIIANNLHIENPSVIFPGDVLCVPIPLPFPCCVVLNRINPALSSDALGMALAQKLTDGNHALIITAINLPVPSTLGNFDMYEGFVGIPGIGGFGFPLSLILSEVPAWTGTLRIKPLLTSGNQLYVIPGNSQTGISGSPILEGNLEQCK
jgi:LysM repeat protein